MLPNLISLSTSTSQDLIEGMPRSFLGDSREAEAPRHPRLPHLQTLPPRTTRLRGEGGDHRRPHDLQQLWAMVPDHRRDTPHAPRRTAGREGRHPLYEEVEDPIPREDPSRREALQRDGPNPIEIEGSERRLFLL